MKSFLIERNICPQCAETDESNIKVIYCRDYNWKVFSQYFDFFYNGVANVDYKKIAQSGYIFQVNKCLSCNILYQKFVPNDDLQKKIYSKWIKESIEVKNNLKNKFERIKYYFDTINRIPKSCKSISKRIFDFGFGKGQWCLEGIRRGYDVYGYEIGQQNIKFGAENQIKVIEIGKIYENAPFVHINFEKVLEHLYNPKEILEKLIDTVDQTCGTIRIAVPNGNNIENDLIKENWLARKNQSNNLNAIAPLEHINAYSFESLISIMKRYNFIILFQMPPAIRDGIDITFIRN